MADVPHKFILRRGKDLVHGNGQFYDAKIRPQMPAGSSQCADQFRSHFRRQFFQLRFRQFLDVRRFADHFQVTPHKSVFPFQSHRPRGQFAFQIFFQLGDSLLGGLQFGFTNLHQLRAFFVLHKQFFQRQLLGFHRFHDGFEFFCGGLKRDVRVGRLFAFAGIGAAYGSVPRRVQRIGLFSRTLHFAVSQAGA